MWLQACLNGSRTLQEHPAVPLTPAAIALDSRCTMEFAKSIFIADKWQSKI